MRKKIQGIILVLFFVLGAIVFLAGTCMLGALGEENEAIRIEADAWKFIDKKAVAERDLAIWLGMEWEKLAYNLSPEAVEKKRKELLELLEKFGREKEAPPEPKRKKKNKEIRI